MQPPTNETPGLSSGAEAQRDREQAREAWSFGIAALALTSVTGCGGFPMTSLVALPLGWIAMTRGRRLLAQRPEPVLEIYARTARVTGLIAVVINGALVVGISLVIVGYVSFIVAMVAGSSSLGPLPSPTP